MKPLTTIALLVGTSLAGCSDTGGSSQRVASILDDAFADAMRPVAVPIRPPELTPAVTDCPQVERAAYAAGPVIVEEGTFRCQIVSATMLCDRVDGLPQPVCQTVRDVPKERCARVYTPGSAAYDGCVGKIIATTAKEHKSHDRN